MHICITRSKKNAYSETFIRNQIQGLSNLAKIYPIHSGRYPERNGDDELLSPKVFWILHKVLKPIVGRNNYFSDFGLKKFLKSNKIDVVIANYGMSAAHMVNPCKALKIPLVAIFHGHDSSDIKLLKKYKTRYTKLFQYASFVVLVSNEMKERIVAQGANPNKIKVIPCGVDTSTFYPSTEQNKRQNLLAVGRFTPKKGPIYTLEAFHKILSHFPNAKLTMVGQRSGLYDMCIEKIEQLNIKNSVEFSGVLNPTDVAILMRNSFAFVQHSITADNGDMEGSPVSIAEASASGIPIISTKHGGITDLVIHSKTGYLVEEKDVDGMANYILKLLENPIDSRKMGLEGRLHVEKNYQQCNQLNKLFLLVQKVVSEKDSLQKDIHLETL